MNRKLQITITFLTFILTMNCFAGENEVLNSKETLTWDLKAFVVSSSSYYTYDEDGILNVVNIFSKSGDELVFSGKRTYYYDENKKLLEDITEDLINDTLKFSIKNQYTLDENNNIIDSTYFTWNSVDGVWNENYRTSSTFNTEGQKIFALGQRWRNNTWESNRYYIYQYNESNIIDTVFSKRWGQGNWRNNAFIVYIYDDENNLTETITKAYWGNNIINFSKVVYVYEDNRLSEISNYFWQNNDWVLQDTQTFDYDDNGKLIMIMIMKTESVGWLANTQNSYFYDDKNNLLRDLKERFVDETWQNNSKIDYNYNDLDLLSNEIHSLWSVSLNDWVKQEKIEYIYSINNKLNIEYSYNWKENNWHYRSSSTYTYDNVENTLLVTNQKYVDSISEWINTTKTSATLTSEGNPLVDVTEKWNELNNWYRNSIKNEYVYDESNYLIQNNHYYWLYTDWFPDTLHLYSNNSNGDPTEYILQTIIDSVWTDRLKYKWEYDEENRVISQLRLRWVNSNWDSTEKEMFYYGEPNLIGVKDPTKISAVLSNYPNPFSEKTTIIFEIEKPAQVQLDLYNNSGIHLRNIKNSFMDIGCYNIGFISDGLPTGVYYLKMTINGYSKTKKLVIVK